LRVQSQQLPPESQVLEDEVLPGTENADQATEEMSERHDHSRNYIGKVRIELLRQVIHFAGVRRFGEAVVTPNQSPTAKVNLRSYALSQAE
jgi:hypothetical protein